MVNRVYLRCSSDTQDLESQRHGIEKWLAAYGEGRTVIRYEEEGISGDAADRPQLRKLLAEVRKGDTVVVWAIDRLSREGIAPTLQTVQKFQQIGARLVSLSEPWLDTDNPCWELILSVLAWSSQQEKKRLKARQRAGIDAAKANGKRWGGRAKGQMQVRTPELDSTVRQMKESGQSISSIARVTKISRPTIYDILKG